MVTVKENYRNLAYKLCEGREVPLLVTDMVAGYLDHRDLFNINVLSRSLNEHANAHIYRDVVIDLDGGKYSIKKASLLFRTLLTSQTAARAVRTLSLAGDPLQDWRNEFSPVRYDQGIEDPLRDRIPPGIHADLTEFNHGEIELYHDVSDSYLASMRPPTSEISLWALFLHMLRLTPHCQDLSVSSDYFRFPDFRRTLGDMARDSSMEKLQSCSLCLDLIHGDRRHASIVKDWDSTLLTLFAVPDLQSFAAVVSLKTEAVRQLRYGGSSITRLVLHHYQVQDFDIDSLLAATPNLRYLEYHARTDYEWVNAYCWEEPKPEHGEGLEALYDALHHVSGSLEELHTSHEFDEDSIYFNPAYAVDSEPSFRQRGELSSLKRLHALIIPYATLLGWQRKDRVWEWDKILPPSLRRIVLTDSLQKSCFIDCWRDQDLMPVISSLVEWLSATERGNEVAVFELHLAVLQSDFNEPVRQELTRMCEERGVRCSIEKVHPDRHRIPRAQWVRRGGRGGTIRGRG